MSHPKIGQRLNDKTRAAIYSYLHNCGYYCNSILKRNLPIAKTVFVLREFPGPTFLLRDPEYPIEGLLIVSSDEFLKHISHNRPTVPMKNHDGFYCSIID